MLGSALPTWKQLFGIEKPAERPYFGIESKYLYTSQSAVSLAMILDACHQIRGGETIRIFVPAFFCADTLDAMRSDFTEIVYYPVDQTFSPEWNTIKESDDGRNPDVFLLVHYFGVPRDTDRARNFCKQRNAILVEDCAHCLYSYEKVGIKGDFALFSPHKLLPIPTGGVIICNQTEGEGFEIWEWLKKNNPAPQGNAILWRVKKAIQKILRVQRSVDFKPIPHIQIAKNAPLLPAGMDRWSRNILNTYDYHRMKQIAQVRRMNLQAMNYVIAKIDSRIIPLISEQAYCPYFAAYSLENVKDKEDTVRQLKAHGLFVTYWPLLPMDVVSLPYFEKLKRLSGELVVLPIHQDLNCQKLIGEVLGKLERKERVCMLEPVDDESMGTYHRNNIPQDVVYGKIRAKHSGNICNRYRVKEDGAVIGHLQTIAIRKWGITLGYRVNRGPVLQEGQDDLGAFRAMREFKKKVGIRPVLWAPNVDFNPQNLHLAYTDGWKLWKPFGFSSGVIDLKPDEGIIRKQFESKWRNQLSFAEKKGYTAKQDNTKYSEVLRLYLEEQKEKGFEGVPDAILRTLFQKECTPLELYYVEEDGEILAFDIVYIQPDTVHYLVGWNSEKGRRNNLNNLLLYQIALQTKAKGIRWFDLGGIDYLETEEIAKFKDGMRPEHYGLLGEFLHF